MIYKAEFTGRTEGAIGAFYPIETTVEADTVEQAELRLYDRYEHISKLKLTPIRPKPTYGNSYINGAGEPLGPIGLDD